MHRTLCLVPLLAAIAAAQQPAPGRGVNFYSIEKEVALGKQLAAEFRRDSIPLDSPLVQAYIDGLGQRLAAESRNLVFTYTFALTTEDPAAIHECPAFPGGFIFVPAGLILAAKDEDELAGMLAHSIAHIAARHGTRNATRAELVTTAATPLIFMGGWAGYAMRQGADLAIPVGMLSFQRAFELQADNLAVQMMSATGYDPAALEHYIEREQASYDTMPRTWSPIPDSTKRVNSIEKAMQTLPVRKYEPHPGLEAVQAEVRRLMESMKPPPTLGK